MECGRRKLINSTPVTFLAHYIISSVVSCLIIVLLLSKYRARISDTLLEERVTAECWLTDIMTASTECIVCTLDSSYYSEHFACVDFTEFLFLRYPFNRTGLRLGLAVLRSQ